MARSRPTSHALGGRAGSGRAMSMSPRCGHSALPVVPHECDLAGSRCGLHNSPPALRCCRCKRHRLLPISTSPAATRVSTGPRRWMATARAIADRCRSTIPNTVNPATAGATTRAPSAVVGGRRGRPQRQDYPPRRDQDRGVRAGCTLPLGERPRLDAGLARKAAFDQAAAFIACCRRCFTTTAHQRRALARGHSRTRSPCRGGSRWARLDPRHLWATARCRSYHGGGPRSPGRISRRRANATRWLVAASGRWRRCSALSRPPWADRRFSASTIGSSPA